MATCSFFLNHNPRSPRRLHTVPNWNLLCVIQLSCSLSFSSRIRTAAHPRDIASTMSYSTSKPNYSSLKYRRRGAWQTRSYENTPSHQENAPEHQDTSLLPAKFRSSSLRLPHAICHNLISLVSRFEALDALSLPFKHSSPQTALWRGPQNSSSRRVGAGASPCTNLSTIVIPSMNKSPLAYPHIFSEDDLPSGRDYIFISSSSPLRLSPATLNSRYLGNAQSFSKPSGTKLCGGDWDACQATASNISRKDKAPNEGPNNKDARRSIRDIIRLYDGSESNSLSLSSNCQ
jgi:hypothetical protein